MSITSKFLIRLDDACPGMDLRKWGIIEEVLIENNIQPMVAVIPDDKYFGSKSNDHAFWNIVRKWQSMEWEIGLHGLTHLVKKIGPMEDKYIFFAQKSEFIGLTLEEQGLLFKTSVDIFLQNGLNPRLFIAPNHGFNDITLRALVEYTRIRIVSDGIGLWPYRESGLTFIPQLDWKFSNFMIGLRTICLHPSTMTDKEILTFAGQIKKNRHACLSLTDVLNLKIKDKSIFNHIFANYFKLYFNTKNLLYSKFKPSK